MKERPDLQTMASDIADKFRLGSYDITIGYVKDLRNERGSYVYGLMQPHADSARIWIGIQDPDTWDEGPMACTPENIRRVVIHELMHVRLCALTAGMSKPAEIVAEEQAVHALADAYAAATESDRSAIERAFGALPPVRGTHLMQLQARGFTRAQTALGARSDTKMDGEKLKALGVVLLMLAMLAESGEGAVKDAAAAALEQMKTAAGDQVEAAIAAAKPAEAAPAAPVVEGGGDMMSMGRAMTEEEQTKAFGAEEPTLANAIKLATKRHTEAVDDVEAKRAELIKANERRIPSDFLPYARSLSVPDLEAFVAALPKKDLPQAKAASSVRGLSVGGQRLGDKGGQDKGVKSVLEGAGLNQRSFEQLTKRLGVSPDKLRQNLEKMVKVEPQGQAAKE